MSAPEPDAAPPEPAPPRKAGEDEPLDRRTLARERILDAARLVPLVGALAMIFPPVRLFALGPGTALVAGALFLFAVWAVLVAATALLARPLAAIGEEE